MTISIEPEDYLSPDAELRARWRAKQLRRGEEPDEFLVESNILGLYGELAVLAFVRSQLPAGWSVLHLADSSSTNSDISLVSPAPPEESNQDDLAAGLLTTKGSRSDAGLRRLIDLS